MITNQEKLKGFPKNITLISYQITLLFIIPRTVLLSSIQLEAETLNRGENQGLVNFCGEASHD